MRKFLFYLLHSAYLLLTVAPAALYISAASGCALAVPLLLFGACSFLGNALSRYVRKRRALFSVLAALLAVFGALLLPLWPWNVMLSVIAAVVLLTGARRRWGEAETAFLDARLLGAGLLLSAVVYILALFNGVPGVRDRVGLLAYFYLVLSLLLLNRQSVRLNAGRQAGRMMRGNQALTWVFLALLTLAAFFSALRDAVGRGLRAALRALLSLFAGSGSGAPTEAGGGMGQMDLGALGGDSTPLPQWLQVLGTVLLTVIAVAALLALAAFLGLALWKGLRALSARLRAWLQRFREEGGEDYAEESEQLLSPESMRRELGQSLRAAVRRALTPPPRWSAMTPAQRVRFVYAALLKREAGAAQALTPQALCRCAGVEEAFAALYDRVRYNGEEPEAQEAERWRSAAKM